MKRDTLSVSLILDRLSSLCRLRGISLRPEGVFQRESRDFLAPPLGELAAKRSERAYPVIPLAFALNSQPQ